MHLADSVCLVGKTIDNTVKDYRKQLQAYVSADSGKFEHYNVTIRLTATNCYI